MDPHLPNPLALEAWHEFNRIKWGVLPLRLEFGQTEGDGARLEAVLYLNRRGRVFLPYGNPYVPLWFRPPSTRYPARAERRWLVLAERAGYRGERTDRLADAHACLMETVARKRFRLDLSLRELELARELLGDEHLRVYVCYGPDGAPAATNIVLHRPGGMAVGWVGGVASSHLSAGAAQLLEVVSMADLASAGASFIDLAGANIPGVALAKSPFGGRLTPYYFVSPVGLKPLAIWMMDWWRPEITRAKKRDGSAAGSP